MHEVVEVVVDKFIRIEEVVVQRKVQVAQRENMDHPQVHLHQIRTNLDAMRATITTPPGNIQIQVSSIMLTKERDTYIGTVLRKDSWVDNKINILNHLT